jgi:hypothetical protein
MAKMTLDSLAIMMCGKFDDLEAKTDAKIAELEAKLAQPKAAKAAPKAEAKPAKPVNPPWTSGWSMFCNDGFKPNDGPTVSAKQAPPNFITIENKAIVDNQIVRWTSYLVPNLDRNGVGWKRNDKGTGWKTGYRGANKQELMTLGKLTEEAADAVIIARELAKANRNKAA